MGAHEAREKECERLSAGLINVYDLAVRQHVIRHAAHRSYRLVVDELDILRNLSCGAQPRADIIIGDCRAIGCSLDRCRKELHDAVGIVCGQGRARAVVVRGRCLNCTRSDNLAHLVAVLLVQE